MGKYNIGFQFNKYTERARVQTLQHNSAIQSNNNDTQDSRNEYFPQINANQDQNSKYSDPLLYKGSFKKELSVEKFRDNKINTCSYVRKGQNNVVAVPFYQRTKRITSNYDQSSKAIHTTVSPMGKMKSTNSDHFSYKPNQTAGMQKKPLEIYSPNSKRSRLPQEDFKMFNVNRSILTIGNRQGNSSDRKHYITTQQNDFGRNTAAHYHAHPGISSFKFKWDHKQRDK